MPKKMLDLESPLGADEVNEAIAKGVRAGGASQPAYLIAYALLKLAASQDRCADQLKWLGTGDAATTMGALEFVGSNLKGMGEAINTAATTIAEAMESASPLHRKG